jgi:hypothetical protein
MARLTPLRSRFGTFGPRRTARYVIEPICVFAWRAALTLHLNVKDRRLLDLVQFYATTAKLLVTPRVAKTRVDEEVFNAP